MKHILIPIQTVEADKQYLVVIAPFGEEKEQYDPQVLMMMGDQIVDMLIAENECDSDGEDFSENVQIFEIKVA